MTRKAPAGVKHARCLDHVPHSYPSSGWLCITTRDETRAADMAVFADHLMAVAARHSAAERSRPIGDGGESLLASVGHTTEVYGSPRKDVCDDAKDCTNGVHASASIHLHPVSGGHLPWDNVAERESRARLAAAFAASQGRPVATISAETPAPVVRKARKVAPVVLPELTAEDIERARRDDVGEPSDTGTAVAHEFGQPCDCGACVEPAPESCPATNGRTTCVKVAGHKGAHDCPTQPTDPCDFFLHSSGIPPSRCVLLIGHEATHEYPPIAASASEPTVEPIALPAPVALATRPTCPRCAQVFRVKGTGLAWHLANRPDCAGLIAAAIPAPAPIAPAYV